MIQENDHVGLCQLIKFGFGLDIGSAIFGTVLAITLSGPVISLLGWDQTVRPLLIIYGLLVLFSFSGTPIGVLRLFNRFDLLGYTTVLNALLKFGGVVICFITRQSLFGFVLIYLVTGIIGQMILVFASLWVLRKQGMGDFFLKPLRNLSRRFPGIWDYVWTTNVNSTIRMASQQSDGLIIAALTTPANLGFFKIAKQFSQVLPELIEPLYESIYPELARLWASGNKHTLLSLIKRTTLIVSIIALSGWIGFILLGKWLIAMTVGPAFSSAYLLAVIYMLALVIALCTFSFSPWMLAMGFPKKSFAALLVSTGIYYVILLIFLSYLGIVGASISYVIFYLVWTGIMLFYLRPYWSKT